MRSFLVVLGLVMIATPALAQFTPDSVGNGGRMPQTMSPGALPPPLPISPPASAAPSPSYGGRYPNTQSLSRERIESQGYRVKKIDPQNDGSWKADVTRDAVPTRPAGVPSKVTIFPDGRVLEERQP